MSWREHREQQEHHVYSELLRVLAMQPLTWAIEAHLSETRKILNISQEAHARMLSEVLKNAEIADFNVAAQQNRLDEPCPYFRKRKRNEDGAGLDVRDSFNLGRGPKLTTAGSQSFAHPVPAGSDVKRGPGRPRVSTPGGVPGQHQGARLKIQGSKKGQFLSRQNSMTDAVPGTSTVPPPAWNEHAGRNMTQLVPDQYQFGIREDVAMSQDGSRFGGGGRGRGRGRGGGPRPRPSSGGRSPQHVSQEPVFIPSYMPCNDAFWADIVAAEKEGRLTEEAIQQMRLALDKRQREIECELRVLCRLEDPELDESNPELFQLLRQALDLKEAAFLAEKQDLDRAVIVYGI
eukprot:jgi/Botrbrau1/13045/Bobra.0187s0008.2